MGKGNRTVVNLAKLPAIALVLVRNPARDGRVIGFPDDDRPFT